MNSSETLVQAGRSKNVFWKPFDYIFTVRHQVTNLKFTQLKSKIFICWSGLMYVDIPCNNIVLLPKCWIILIFSELRLWAELCGLQKKRDSRRWRRAGVCPRSLRPPLSLDSRADICGSCHGLQCVYRTLSPGRREMWRWTNQYSVVQSSRKVNIAKHAEKHRH